MSNQITPELEAQWRAEFIAFEGREPSEDLYDNEWQCYLAGRKAAQAEIERLDDQLDASHKLHRLKNKEELAMKARIAELESQLVGRGEPVAVLDVSFSCGMKILSVECEHPAASKLERGEYKLYPYLRTISSQASTRGVSAAHQKVQWAEER